ncbi:MAG TPA: aminopeptidase N [Mycobacteriales bacterium]|nr:aminopeptidase N [Mycobacteriales bacterium]
MPSPNLTRDDARRRAELVDVTHYAVDLDLTDGGGKPGERTFRSHTTVRFSCATPGATTFVDLVADHIRAATLNGAPLDVSGYTPVRGITLPDLAADNELVVDADCAYTNTGQGLHRFVDPVDGEVYLYTQFETADAKRMFTCFDQPDIKATFSFGVTAPATWAVVSNGPVREVTDTPAGARVTRFDTTRPLPPYVTALVAGPYHRVTDHHDGIDLGLYCRASMAPYLDSAEILEVTRNGFDWYHQAFDYRYPFGKYDQLFVPEFNMGAMENAGCVTFAEDYLFRSRVTDSARERRAETILHEMAHMWFGDLVTMRWWDDLWLNESFASFASVLCQSRATRWSSAWTTFANVEKSWACRQDQLPSTHPIAADIPDVRAVEVNFDGITYAKGASVLKQLASYVGIEPFLDAMKVYFRRHEYGNTTLADLLRACEEVSGRDLSRWSDQWLRTAGINTLRADFEVDDTGRFTSFAVLQDAPGEHNALRDHRLVLARYAGTPLRRTGRVEVDVSGARAEIPALVGTAQPDLLLVNDDDLTYTKLRLDARSLATLTERIGELTDSLPRALCWSATWDMTRDAEMAARHYIALVLAGSGVETDVGLVQSLLRQAFEAVHSFADPTWAPAGLHLLADRAYRELHAATPGSDHQLVWARALRGAARTDEHVAFLAGLLDGSTTVNGLRVDTELRWGLLCSLVALGSAGDGEIDAELERDPTAAGQRRAATARALRPTAEAKAEAWRAATEDDDLPNAMQEAVIGGFAHPEHLKLLEPYLDLYFDMIGPVWQRRPAENAHRVVVGLYPSRVAESTVERTDRFLAGTMPDALRRLVVEQRDDVVRALKARRRDAATG